MKELVLEPADNEVKDGYIKRRCKVKYLDYGTCTSEKELWFRFTETIEPPVIDDCDSYLLAMLMDAMQEGRDIIVKGSVSRTLLSNLVEFQRAWNKWLPDKYKIVDMKPDLIREKGQPLKGAVSAFSAGVDATFTVWMNSKQKNSYRSQDIKFCTFVHGFDVQLNNTEAFNNIIKRSNQTLSDLNLSIRPVSTNYREISCTNWSFSHAAAITAALSNFKNEVGACLIGSSEPYSSLAIPWGSSPITDHLLSSGEFMVFHDGASFSRIEKINEISAWQNGVDNLRVCWEGFVKDSNCGRCEKCVRTMTGFLASNHSIPSSFKNVDNIEKRISKTMLRTELVYGEWGEILEFAEKNNSEWKRAVYKVIRRNRIIDGILPRNSWRRKIITRLIGQK